jgi:hypothetical protein
MLDPIIDSKLAKFRTKMELGNVSDGIAFEKFVNYSILSGHQPGAFNGDSELFDKVNIGGYEDAGIDGIAIKINGILIRSLEETKSLVEKLPRLEIEFIFIQSKYKEAFTKDEFISFTSGVRDFLSPNPRMPHSIEIQEFVEIKDYLTSEDAVCKWSDSPLVRLYYVTMAKSHNSHTQNALADQFKEDIVRLNTYNEPVIHFINRSDLKSIIDSNESNFEQTINFIYSMPLTRVDDVSDSCVLLIYATELKKILRAPDGLIRKSLFDDNVRDFQGNNAINSAINNTINIEPEKFVLLNNGITIVCEKFSQSNMQINIKNPQIVNGCQTSHVLYNNSDDILGKTPVIIKLISTENGEITNQIVRGTNSQNIVYSEAFETIKPFHKDLEDFINALSPEYERFYYERRSKQYDQNPSINYFQKINLRIIIQSFVGMFFNCPHLSHKHESKLLEIYSDKIFLDYQSKYPYFTSALSYYKLEAMFRRKEIENKQLYAFKMHILMIFRELVSGPVQDINDETLIEGICKKMLLVLKNDVITMENFQKAIEVFNSARDIWINVMKRDQFRIKDVKDFTDLLISKLHEGKNIVNNVEVNSRSFGRIIHIGVDRNGMQYGFIRRQSQPDIFFHSNKSPEIDFKDKKYFEVSYKIEKDIMRGDPVAVDIIILSDTIQQKIHKETDSTMYKPFAIILKKKNGT